MSCAGLGLGLGGDDDVVWFAGHGSRLGPGVGHLGTDEDQTAGANDRRRCLSCETAAASIR